MKIVFCDAPYLAVSTPWSIRVGMPFWQLSNDERAAVLLHELAHQKLKHPWIHLMWMLVWWLAPSRFALGVKEHEHEADEFVVRCGHGNALIRVLARSIGEDPGPLHPSASARIARIRKVMEKQPHGLNRRVPA
jgi:Zn-dependent protease with chaperone function